jgi:hypothetical protein
MVILNHNNFMSKKQNFILLLLVIILVLVGVVYGAYYIQRNNHKPVACTTEAKLCPDGSSVGRTGPNCEFAACPVTDPTANWQTYVNVQYGFEFKFPKSFGAEIWRAYKWPPLATVVPANENLIKQGCPDIQTSSPEQSQLILNGNNFTLYKESEGAAGSTFTTYCYTTKKDQNNYTIEFLIRYTSGCGENCGPYCGTPNETACRNFDKVKEVEKPIEQMISTFKFTK